MSRRPQTSEAGAQTLRQDFSGQIRGGVFAVYSQRAESETDNEKGDTGNEQLS